MVECFSCEASSRVTDYKCYAVVLLNFYIRENIMPNNLNVSNTNFLKGILEFLVY